MAFFVHETLPVIEQLVATSVTIVARFSIAIVVGVLNMSLLLHVYLCLYYRE